MALQHTLKLVETQNQKKNPEYQYPGYICCDGSEYYIKDYPQLYEAIGNEYGGTASDGVDVLTGGNGYDAGTTNCI